MDGLKAFKCPKCLDIPGKEIFLCKNGHPICHSCVANSVRCPESQCGVLLRYGKVRNLPLELLLDPIDFECVYKVAGCNQVRKRAELKHHVETCGYSRENPLLCKMIGYNNCQFIPSAATRADILEHFRTNHDDVIIQNGGSAVIHLEDIRSVVADDIKDFWWRSCLLNFESNETGPLLLILSSTNSHAKMTSWMCVLLWADEKKDVPNLFAGLRLEGVDTVEHATPELKCTLPAIDIRKAKPFLEEGFPWKVCNNFLIQHYLSDAGEERDIVLKVTLMRKDEPPVTIERNGNDEATTGRENFGLSTVGSSLSIASSCSTRRPKHSSTPAVIFGSVTCKSCKKSPICGPRFKCLQCVDFDLCGQCVGLKIHSEHVIAMIRDPRQNPTISSIMNKLFISSNEPSEVSEGEESTTTNSRRSSETAVRPSPAPCGRNSRRSGNSISSSGYTFDNPTVTCDICDMGPLCGYRYNCAQCENFDSCSNCIEKGEHHTHHVFVVIRNEAQNKKLEGWISRTAASPRILLVKEEQSMDGNDKIMDMDLTCKLCSEHPIVGRLYSCLTCPGYYLCSQCIDQDEHSHRHLFIMTRFIGQQSLLDANRNFIAGQLRCKPTSTKRKRFE